MRISFRSRSRNLMNRTVVTKAIVDYSPDGPVTIIERRTVNPGRLRKGELVAIRMYRPGMLFTPLFFLSVESANSTVGWVASVKLLGDQNGSF